MPKSSDEDKNDEINKFDSEINEDSSLHWKKEDIKGLMQDLNEPLPDPPYEQPILTRINFLLRWLCCFILYWQVITRVSDTAVDWLLLFLGKFYKCLERKFGTVLPKQCSNILFPRGKAKHCGTKLVNKVILKSGATRFYPLKVYYWKSIISQLESILQRTGILEICEQ